MSAPKFQPDYNQQESGFNRLDQAAPTPERHAAAGQRIHQTDLFSIK